VDSFLRRMEKVSRECSSRVIEAVGLFVADFNNSDDPARVLSTFLGAFVPKSTTIHDGVTYADGDLLPGVSIYFPEDGTGLLVRVGEIENELALSEKVRPVVKRLVEVEGGQERWYTTKHLYQLLTESESVV